MGMVQNQICDHCGRVLFGKEHGEKVARDALEIKDATIKTQRVDKKTQWRQYEYISPFREADLAFCIENEKENPFACFLQYVLETEARKQQEQQKDTI